MPLHLSFGGGKQPAIKQGKTVSLQGEGRWHIHPTTPSSGDEEKIEKKGQKSQLSSSRLPGAFLAGCLQ